MTENFLDLGEEDFADEKVSNVKNDFWSENPPLILVYCEKSSPKKKPLFKKVEKVTETNLTNEDFEKGVTKINTDSEDFVSEPKTSTRVGLFPTKLKFLVTLTFIYE